MDSAVWSKCSICESEVWKVGLVSLSPRMRLAGRGSSTHIWIAVIDECIEMFDRLPDTHSELFSAVKIVAGLDVVFDRLL
jgi:hypothetical protein